MLAVPSAQSSPCMSDSQNAKFYVDPIRLHHAFPSRLFHRETTSLPGKYMPGKETVAVKTGRRGSVSEIKIEVFSEEEKGFFVPSFGTKSAEVV